MARKFRVDATITAKDQASPEFRKAEKSVAGLGSAADKLSQEFAQTRARADRLQKELKRLKSAQDSAAASAARSAVAQKTVGSSATAANRRVGALSKGVRSLGESLRSTFLVTPIVGAIAALTAALGVAVGKAAASTDSFDDLGDALSDLSDEFIIGVSSSADFERSIGSAKDAAIDAKDAFREAGKFAGGLIPAIDENFASIGKATDAAAESTKSFIRETAEAVLPLDAIGAALSGLFQKATVLVSPIDALGAEIAGLISPTKTAKEEVQSFVFTAERLGEAAAEDASVLGRLESAAKKLGITMSGSVNRSLKENEKLLLIADDALRRNLISGEKYAEIALKIAEANAKLRGETETLTTAQKFLSDGLGGLALSTGRTLVETLAFGRAQREAELATLGLTRALAAQESRFRGDFARQAEQRRRRRSGAGPLFSTGPLSDPGVTTPSGGVFTITRKNRAAPDGRVIFT